MNAAKKIRKYPNISFENVAKIRKDLGLTQEQLAEKTGLCRTFIAEIESGRKHPGVYSLAKIAIALEVKEEDLRTIKVPEKEED